MKDFKASERVEIPDLIPSMQRQLDQFNGDGLLVGGGWSKSHQYLKPSIRNSDNFYTIDIDGQEEPDAVIDITDEMQCSVIPSKRFNLIYFECFPYQSETYLLKAFNIAHRILKEEGILIYHGGSDKSASSIPEILKNAGFVNTIKKEMKQGEPRADMDNGSISLASDTCLNRFQENFPTLSNTMRFYLTRYQFFSNEPYSMYGFNFKRVNAQEGMEKYNSQKDSLITDQSFFNRNDSALFPRYTKYVRQSPRF